MDYSPIVAQVWGMLTWFIPAALLIGLLKSPWAKGQIGELLVRLFAHWQLDRQTYRRLHNVTLNTPDGTTQIDHVFLSPYGIFVLETAGFQHLPIGLYRCTGEPCCRSQASVSIATHCAINRRVAAAAQVSAKANWRWRSGIRWTWRLCSPPERGRHLSGTSEGTTGRYRFHRQRGNFEVPKPS